MADENIYNDIDSIDDFEETSGKNLTFSKGDSIQFSLSDVEIALDEDAGVGQINFLKGSEVETGEVVIEDEDEE